MTLAVVGPPFIMSVAILLLFMGLAMGRRPTRLEERLKEFGGRTPTLEELELQLPFTDRVLKPGFISLAKAVSRWAPKTSIQRIRDNLVIAGNPGNLHAAEFVGLKGIMGVGLGVGTAVLLMIAHASPLMLILLAGALGALGYFLPSVWLGQKVKARQKAVRRSLPDAIDLLTISVEAGLGFDGAMQRVSEKWDNALSEEFGRVLAEMRVGKSRREALREMVARTKVDELSAFVASIIQADQLGVSISKVLRIQADQMRVQRRQRAQELAQKAPLKILFPMAFLIFPSIYVMILGPAVPRVFNAFLR